ncbi:MAG: sigma-70 family RNA polymerase sigma factor, partial [Planctomycetes bacterium]|nr:sigma-70 family RNA polymerase sigma factor [Planctomycetota bacterium]
FISWLLVISSRLALNHLRNEKPHRLPHIDDCQVAAGGLGPARQIENEDQAVYIARCLDRVLSTMNEKARLLYELKFRQELSLEEMAEHLACSVSAVKVRVHRLRKSLQEALREDMEVLL